MGVVGVGAGRNSEDDQIGDDRWGRRGSRRSDLRPAWPATHSNTLITHWLEEMGVSVTSNQHSFGEFIQLRIIIFGWWRNGHISGAAVFHSGQTEKTCETCRCLLFYCQVQVL